MPEAAHIYRQGIGLAPAPLQTVRASRVAPRARDWLTTTANGRVLHVFDAAVYIVNEDGDILSLTSSGIGAGPLSLVIPTAHFHRLVSAGAPVLVDAETLETGRLRVVLTDAAIWDSRPPWQDLAAGRAFLLPRWDWWTELVVRHSPAGSLASLLVPEGSGLVPGSMQGTLQAAAALAARRLIDSLEIEGPPGEPAPSVAKAAREIAGLGTGFTPAGDDFIVGTMYALWSSWPATRAAALCSSIAEAAVSRTTRVSGALLRAAAEGHAGDAWHKLVTALLADQPTRVESALAALAAVGHTSGADALAGYLLTLKSAHALE